jgi:glycosyltransferase involved in cell wall biosynthesis
LPAEQVAEFRQKHGLPKRYILYLGTLEPRKNLVTLLKAYAALTDPDVHLVLAGGKGWLCEDIFAEVSALGLEERVHFPGYLSDMSLPLWYNAAEAFAYVSWYEGFGLPVLEAMACGTPTVASNTTSLPEVAGDAALLVPPDDVEAIREALKRCLSDQPLRTRLQHAGREQAAAFTWDKTAERTVALYKTVLRTRSSHD